MPSKIPLFVPALIALVLVGCAGAAAPLTPTVPIPPSPTPAAKSGKLRYFDNANLDVRDVPLLMALDDLAAQGYTVEHQSLATSSLLVDALGRGDADIISVNTQTAWTAINKGLNARTFMGKTGSTLIVQAKKEIKDCSALNGRPVGVAAATGINPTMFSLYLDKACPGTEPQLVIIPDNTNRVTALIAGQVDAALLQSEQLVQLEHDAPGRFGTLEFLYKDFDKLQNNGLHVRNDWAQQNPGLLKDFIQALVLANRRVIAQPQVLYDEAVKRLKLDAVSAKNVGDAYLQAGLWDQNGGFSPDSLQYTLDFMIQSKVLPRGIKPADVADLSYLNAVLDEIGRQ